MITIAQNGVTLPRAKGRKPLPTHIVYWALFCGSAAAFLTQTLLSPSQPIIHAILDIASLVTCGLAWLFARGLFRKSGNADVWPLYLVGLLFFSTLLLYLTKSHTQWIVLDYVGTLQALLGSAMLVLIGVEALNGGSASRSERRFQAAFATGYGFIICISLIGRLPDAAPYQEGINAALAAIAVCGATACCLYRNRNPLNDKSSARSPLTAAHNADPALINAIERLFDIDAIYRQTGLKVAHVSERLHVPAYKVSQAVVGTLGYANFNALVNQYRIDDAMRRLASPDHSQDSILVISMDCGFGSLGPFNRSFKARTGLSPSQFRKTTSIDQGS